MIGKREIFCDPCAAEAGERLEIKNEDFSSRSVKFGDLKNDFDKNHHVKSSHFL